MGKRGKGRNKEKQKIRGPLGTKIDTTTSLATAPESMLAILAVQEINPQEHIYRCSFHLRVIQGYQIQGNVCVLSSYSQYKDTPRQEVMIERIPKNIIVL
jgi:hypothetical protein